MAEKQEMEQPQSRRRRRDGSSSSASQRMCPHCGRVFKRSEHLERHVRTHTKEKPYVCQCGSAFSRRDLLTRHMRISHETNDGTSKSPDAPVSDEGLQIKSEPVTPNDPASSRLDFAPDRGVPPSQYLDSNHDLVMAEHAAGGSYHQLSPRYYSQGHQYSTIDQYTGYPSMAEAGNLQSPWNTYYNDPGSEQDMVDPILRSPMSEQMSPLHSELHSHSYSWMPASQPWSN